MRKREAVPKPLAKAQGELRTRALQYAVAYTNSVEDPDSSKCDRQLADACMYLEMAATEYEKTRRRYSDA